jgi:hypothetical protein
MSWEGDRPVEHGASGLVCGPESGIVAAMEAGAVVERDPSGTRQAPRIDLWRVVIEQRVHSCRSQAVALGADARGARRAFSWHGVGSVYAVHSPDSEDACG